MPNGLNLSLKNKIKKKKQQTKHQLDPIAILQDIERREECIDLYHEFAVSKIQTGKFYRPNVLDYSTNKLQGKERHDVGMCRF